MSDNMLAKLTSPKWLKEAFSGRARNFVNSFDFRPSIIDREVAGEAHRFYIGNVTGKSWYNFKHDPCHEMTFAKRHLMRPGAVVIECGAHHGAQTILLSRWVGDAGRVIAVEPMPENLAILRRNIELNGLTNVTVVEKAAGSVSGQLFMATNSNGSVRTEGKNSIEVESITLDQLSKDLGITPDFIKIDVEGFEYQILEGCRSILPAIPAVFVEVHTLTLPRYGKVFEDLWTLIDADQYDIFIQSDDREAPAGYTPGFTPAGRVHLYFKPRLSR
jgi:FkbM family methyltransferase